LEDESQRKRDRNNHINRLLLELLVLLCSIIMQQYTLQCTIHGDSSATLPRPPRPTSHLRCGRTSPLTTCSHKTRLAYSPALTMARHCNHPDDLQWSDKVFRGWHHIMLQTVQLESVQFISYIHTALL